MAKKILVSYDFSKLELLNVRIQNLASDPASPVEGQLYWNTASKYPAIHNGTSFINLLSRANHTGTQAWSTLTATPTTLSGYGITDATPSSHVGSGGTAHADVVAGGASGFMTGAQATKLAGIATGATANSSDATLLARANHTGTQLASTISDFDTQVRTSRLDQMAAPTADVSLNSRKITNLADGTNANDAVNFAQLQSVANGTDWKASVRVIATTNITLSGLQTIDSISVLANDRVAVTGQSTPSQNGIYVAGSGAWTRATDADGNSEVTPGMAFFVEEGTVYADSQWRLTTNGAIVVGTTSLTFAQIGAGTTYTNGTGLSLAGNVFSIDTAVVTRKFAQNIGDNSATSITVTHGLGTLDVQVQVVQVSTGETVECDVTRGSTTQVTLGFAVAPTVNQYRVIVQG